MWYVFLHLQVLFAWWGAEELGLFGSSHFVMTRTTEELDLIACNLNFDMIVCNYSFVNICKLHKSNDFQTNNDCYFI